MRGFVLVLLTALASCAYPKGAITIVDDAERIDLHGISARAGFVPMTVCVDPEDQYASELRQLARSGVEWWNNWLRGPVGCDVFSLDLVNTRHLYCDVIAKSGPLPPNVSGVLRAYWTARSDPPGDFARGTLILEQGYFNQPDYHIGVMRHELGHALGLDDDPGRPLAQFGSVMSSPLPVVYRPTLQDLRLVRETAKCVEDETLPQ